MGGICERHKSIDDEFTNKIKKKVVKSDAVISVHANGLLRLISLLYHFRLTSKDFYRDAEI